MNFKSINKSGASKLLQTFHPPLFFMANPSSIPHPSCHCFPPAQQGR